MELPAQQHYPPSSSFRRPSDGPAACNHTSSSSSTATSPARGLHPGHDAILEMHANSESNAVTYVLVVLLLYAFALLVVLVKYLRNERYEARLSRLYEEFTRRDRFPRASAKTNRNDSAGSAPAPSTDTVDYDCPRSPSRPNDAPDIVADSCL